MKTGIDIKNHDGVYLDCISGLTSEIIFEDGSITQIIDRETSDRHIAFVGPGLTDLQVNGVNGIDFNNASITKQQISAATNFLLQQGVTTFLPTLITNSEENICRIASVIHEACTSDDLVNKCIWGIHLEGPFLSDLPGAKGAHDAQYIRLPDWHLFEKFQQAAGGRIKLVTIAPELAGAYSFIEKCRENNIMVSIGHSMANAGEIKLAVKAGASLITHLGNGLPLNLPRHPNILWDLLATEELYACIIADGIHVPDSFIKVVMKTKGASTIIVSDATCFAGMPPGEYQTHIGGEIILDAQKRISLKNFPGLLAGAAKTLLENVETMVAHNISTLGEVWKMASSNAADLLAKNDEGFHDNKDFVIFEQKGSTIQVKTVIKDRRIVFEQ